MATHSSILVWRIPWVEEPDGLQSTGSQRVGHDWATNTHEMFRICISSHTQGPRIQHTELGGIPGDLYIIFKSTISVQEVNSINCITILQSRIRLSTLPPTVMDLVKEGCKKVSSSLNCFLSSSTDSRWSWRNSAVAADASSLTGSIILFRSPRSSFRTFKQSFSISRILERSCCKRKKKSLKLPSLNIKYLYIQSQTVIMSLNGNDYKYSIEQTVLISTFLFFISLAKSSFFRTHILIFWI